MEGENENRPRLDTVNLVDREKYLTQGKVDEYFLPQKNDNSGNKDFEDGYEQTVDWFDFFISKNINLQGLFNAKTILVEEQWNYLIHTGG